MKTVIVTMILAGIVTFTVAAEPQKIDLPKSGSVILTSSMGENAFQYEVLLKKTTGQEIKLSSVKILAPGRVSAPQGEVRYLMSCDENSDMIVVLMATSPWGLILLQYDLATKVVREERLSAGNLMDDRRATDGALSVHPPNRITLSQPNGTSQSWTVVDGQFVDENGNVFVQNTQRALQTSETTPTTSPANTVPASVLDTSPPASTAKAPAETTPAPTSRQNEKQTSTVISTTWSVIVILIVAALGLLWLLFKRRS
jgi:hypothetical protein